MDELVDRVRGAIERRHWETLRPLLHPYLHWRRADGTVLRGRTRVMTWLAAVEPPQRPASFELRDDQVYRWNE